MLFFSPVTHYLRGAFFLISRFHNIPNSVAFVHQLCNGQASVDAMGNAGPQRYMMMKEDWETDLEKASQELCEQMERCALPSVQHIVDRTQHEATPEYVGGIVGCPSSPKYVFTVALGACSDGDFDAAEKIMSHAMGLLSDEYPVASATEEFRYHPILMWRMAYLMRLLQIDRSRILPLLHDWEAHAVKGMKLTKYWKPTPFPCEM